MEWLNEVKSLITNNQPIPISEEETRKIIVLYSYNLVDFRLKKMICFYYFHTLTGSKAQDFEDDIYPNFAYKEKQKVMKKLGFEKKHLSNLDEMSKIRNLIAHGREQKEKYVYKGIGNILSDINVLLAYINDCIDFSETIAKVLMITIQKHTLREKERTAVLNGYYKDFYSVIYPKDEEKYKEANPLFDFITNIDQIVINDIFQQIKHKYPKYANQKNTPKPDEKGAEEIWKELDDIYIFYMKNRKLPWE